MKIGRTAKMETVVDDTNIAKSLASGDLEVFATPSMIALMEHAAAACVAPLLEEGQGTVGTRVEVEHTSATPMGMKVTAYAQVTAWEGKRIEFKVWAEDECGPIGQGTHTRAVINNEKFLQRTNGKRAPKA